MVRNSIVSALVFTIYLFSPLLSLAQKEDKIEKWKHVVGFGVLDYYLVSYPSFTIEYGIHLKRRNELTFPIYVYNYKNTYSIGISSSFHFSIVKNERRRFNLFLSPGFTFYHEWNHSQTNIHKQSTTGTYLCFGLIPQFRISPRLNLALEMKIGYGYTWYNREPNFQNGVFYGSYGEWQVVALPSLRLKYNFGKR